MEKQDIKKLAREWELTSYKILSERDIPIQKTQELLRDTYKLCTLYHDKDLAPKEVASVFVYFNSFLSSILVIDNIDEYSSSSDCARYDAIGRILDEISEGFYSGKYTHNYPYIQVDDSRLNTHVLNLEEDFLEDLIYANF
jgi:hypothetical protein